MSKVIRHKSQVKSQKLLVALSGGVDSAVAAYLLQKQGYDVHAVFMKNFSEREMCGVKCPWREDRMAAYEVASFLKIPITTWEFENEYRKTILTYLYREYKNNRTPNPDILCNKIIKLGSFLKRAQALGFQMIATGHYVRLQRDFRGTYHLLKGVDSTKDQSYFLAGLDQKQLRHCLFPLGDTTKKQVRALAARLALPNAHRPDSQGICFVGPVNMRAFLKNKIKSKKGDIVNLEGSVVGHHEGIWFYTVGQRKGIQIGGGPALYVIDKKKRANQLIVGPADSPGLFKKEVYVKQWHWVARVHGLPTRVRAKIRYRQDDQIVALHEHRGHIRAVFTKLQRAVSPGQFLVAYKGAEVIGCGVID